MTIMDLSNGGGGWGPDDVESTFCTWNNWREDSNASPSGKNVSSGGQGSLSSWSQIHLGNLLNFGGSENDAIIDDVRDATNDNDVDFDNGSSTSRRPEDEIAHALNKLSFDQREKVYHDIHGISSDNTLEDPDMVEEKLKSLDEQLHHRLQDEILPSSYLSSSVSALKLAMDQDPTYLGQESFRLPFLRAEEWKPDQAADRLMKFLEQKKELFGVEKLTKDITLDDLDQHDMSSLASGGMQTVPLQDQSGRHILIAIPELEDYRTPENLLRSFYYILMSIAMQVAAQRKGLIAVVYFMGDFKKRSDFYQVRKRVQRLRSAIPIKMAAGHVCTDDPRMELLLRVVRPWINLYTLTRIRFHLGHHMEVQYALSTFGIPVAALPVDCNGVRRNDYQQLWIQRRRKIEQKQERTKIAPHPTPSSLTTPPSLSMVSPMETSSSSTPVFGIDSDMLQPERPMTPPERPLSPGTVILHPESSDCILGRGRAIDQHQGNIKFRRYLQSPEVLKQYQDTPKYMKFQVAEPIQKILQEEQNVRFLKEHPSGRGWIIADDAAVRSKILRTFRRFITQQQQAKAAG